MRDSARLFERYGRQLLVEGVQFDGQQRLAGLCAVFASDQSDVAQEAARACGRWLVGAGLGRAVAPSAWRAELQAQDADLELVASPAEAVPPAAHFYFAQRPYGASVDVALTDAPAGWASGASEPARVATLRWELGDPAAGSDAVAVGTAAADLLLADIFGVEPLPAHVAVDWRDPANPTRKATPRNPGPTASVRADGGPEVTALLPELRATTGAWQGIVAEAAAQYPNEACGFVVRQANGQLESVAAPNLQDRYHALDPAAYPRTARTAYKLNERLIAKAQDAGATLVCIWHSHCDAGAYFSGEDVRCAAPDGQELYPGVRWLVVSVLGGKVANAAMYVFAPEVGEFFAE